MFQLPLLLVAVTATVTADTTTRTTTTHGTTTPWPTTTHRTTTHYVPGCESQYTWPFQHALGESWTDVFESYCQVCTCHATGKVCEDCPPRDCVRPADIFVYHQHFLAAGESATFEFGPDNCVYCHCRDYWAHCYGVPCDGIIT